MKIYFEEKIGDPKLFTGRQAELHALLAWVRMAKKRLARSEAMLSRRKTGKTAIMHRLFNILFHQNDGAIPFYYEIKETPQWMFDFSVDFFLTFTYQYIGYRSRNKRYINTFMKSFDNALEIAKKEGCHSIVEPIKFVHNQFKEKNAIAIWDTVRDLPREIGWLDGEPVIQMIDEFQYLNRYIYRDQMCTNHYPDFAGTYFHTAEYKTGPLLISSSWMGWLMRDLSKMLPSRFRHDFVLDNMPENETIETIFKYSDLLEQPITNEIAQLMLELTQGNPCYISSLFFTTYIHKDFTTEDGFLKTVEFEVLRGGIKARWMEYLSYAFTEINGYDSDLSKKIVLYLCKNKDREVSRAEIKKDLQLDISDNDLEKRMHALVLSDIVNQGRSQFYYRGISDHLFDRVFKGHYSDEIELFDPKEITNEYKVLFKHWKEKFHVICGKYGSLKGRFAEYMVTNHLKYRAYDKNEVFCSMMNNLPLDFEFVYYQSVWKYTASPVLKNSFEIDVFAEALADQYSLIGEIKNRLSPFSIKEATDFISKANQLIQLENVGKHLLFVYSIEGFTQDTLQFFKENKIAWCDDERWLDNVICNALL
ncbi:ATPase domain protein, prokaryote domain protein [Candidatus Magnetomorum sp. HK-1]|nr:ATPase domain protein, prokaryote domain protein [Candidatus Magnetomorum sp. HK-1]